MSLCRRPSSFVFAYPGAVAWTSPGRHLGNHMAETPPTEFFIQGITKDGKKFRPSDWSERLAGVMACFGPGASGPNARLKYSLYVRPTMLGDLKCVILDSRLRDIEPMAFDFVLNFAKDNNLVVTEACELPDYNTKKWLMPTGEGACRTRPQGKHCRRARCAGGRQRKSPPRRAFS